MNFSYQPRAFSFMRTVHDKLPPFKYHPLATDRLTQLFATWHFAASHIDWNTPWIPDEDGAKLEKCHNRVDEFHRRRFLKAFAKSHAPKKSKHLWSFGAAKFYTTTVQPNAVINYARAFLDRYAKLRYWRQHIPKLP